MLYDQLEEKFIIYSDLLNQDSYGFIESHECDSLLFTGLVGCLPSVSVDIDAAFDKETGMWHRRPTNKLCFPIGSRSTISRDMLIGLAFYCYYNKRLDISEQIIKYALSHYGIMGKANNKITLLSRCFIGPGLLATFAWISFRLGGPSRSWLRWIPADTGPIVKDYQAHLQVLHILLRARLSHYMSKRDRRVLKEQLKRQPNNPLFLYANDHKDLAARMLLDQTLWPPFSLPTKGNRKTQWIPMRDEGKDWMPDLSDSKHIHSGGDFLFNAALILNKF